MSRVESIERSRRWATVHPDQSVESAAVAMSRFERAGLPVVEGERLVGVVTERDVLRNVVARGRSPSEMRVRDVMTTDFAVARPGEGCRECLDRMAKHECRILPIVEGDRLVGLISLLDVLRAEVDEQEEALHWMQDYLEFVPPG